MPRLPFVVIDDGRPAAVSAHIDADGVRLPAGAVREALGWEVRPQGLCRGELCVPLPAGPALAAADPRGLDLTVLAGVLRRPLALDLDERAAALAAPVEERCRALASLEAPDFTLPDLDGRPHRLRDQRGRKVMLVAYASW